MSNYEIEYSFICTDTKSLDELRRDLYCTKTLDLADLYFDTDDGLLSKHKFVLRQRYEEGKIFYTLKGPTSGTNPPQRLELEDRDIDSLYKELEKRLPEEIDYHKLDVIQERYTKREVYEFPAQNLTLYIDSTKFENGAQYVNIEVEGTDIEQMNEFKQLLLKKEGIKEWKPSKFQMGEAVKALDMTGPLGTEEFHKIQIYFGNKKEKGKKEK